MKVNDKHIVLFDKYLDHELSSKWIKAFEEKLKADSQFKEAFEEHKLVRYAINMEGRSLLKNELITLTPSLPKAKKYKPNTGGGLIKGFLVLGVTLNLILLSWFYILPCLNTESNPASEISQECIFEEYFNSEKEKSNQVGEIKETQKEITPIPDNNTIIIEKEVNIDSTDEIENSKAVQNIRNSSNSELLETIIDTNIIFINDTVYIDEKGVPIEMKISTPGDTTTIETNFQINKRQKPEIEYRYDTVKVESGTDFELPEGAIKVE